MRNQPTVIVSDEHYYRSHGKSPRGRGDWLFWIEGAEASESPTTAATALAAVSTRAAPAAGHPRT